MIVSPASSPAHRFAMVGGLRLHLLDWGGDGRPILLLHGVGSNAWMWAHIAPALTDLGRPLALDLRGFGDSQWSPEHAYTTEDHLGDVVGVLDALELGQVDIVGFSWGGLIGIALAAAEPERVRRFAAIDSAPSTAAAVDAVPPGFRGSFTDHDDAVAADSQMAPRAEAGLISQVVACSTRAAPGGGLVRKLDPYLLERWPFRADDRWEQLRAVRAPALVVRGGDSPLLSSADAERMAAELPTGRLEVVPDSGHLVAHEQPQRLTSLLREFLAG